MFSQFGERQSQNYPDAQFAGSRLATAASSAADAETSQYASRSCRARNKGAALRAGWSVTESDNDCVSCPARPCGSSRSGTSQTRRVRTSSPLPRDANGRSTPRTRCSQSWQQSFPGPQSEYAGLESLLPVNAGMPQHTDPRSFTIAHNRHTLRAKSVSVHGPPLHRIPIVARSPLVARSPVTAGRQGEPASIR
jgi:hypothetical protein